MDSWLPNLNCAVMAWASMTKVFISGKYQADYRIEETYFERNVNIFRVPTGQRLEMKMEGQRAWNNETIYTDNALDLSVDDIIIFNCFEGQKYRILNKTDWSAYGYIEYEITSDYK